LFIMSFICSAAKTMYVEDSIVVSSK